MRILRTPEDRFEDLPDFPYEPHYTEVPSGEGEMLRMAHVEAGPAAGPAILLLHGEPSWSLLYRKMMPVFAAAGFRAIAPDLVGFGRSDKPASVDDYTYGRHVGWVKAWMDSVGLGDVTLFCQDWGGLIGLRLVAENPERFSRVVAGNTFLPTGDQPAGQAFERWKEYALTTPEFNVGKIVAKGTVNGLTPDVQAAYDAPFPTEEYKAGARVFPRLVPVTPDDPAAPDNRKAWEVLMKWEKPFLTTFGDSDPITKGADGILQALIPGAQGQPHTTIEQAAHFLQEDQGEKIAEYVAAWVSGS
jgi:haloalkane dehalogenase